MAGQSPQNWHEQMMVQARRKPGQTGAMVVLLAIMAVMWGRQLLSGGRGAAPSAAQAATPVLTTLPGGMANPSLCAMRVWLAQPIRPTRRNLFAVRMELFPEDGNVQMPAITGRGGFWCKLAKSVTAQADQERTRRIQIQNLRSMASKLELQSTLMSNGSPKAMVNGTLYGEGEVVASFRIVKIEAKRIVVERDGVKLEVLFRF